MKRTLQLFFIISLLSLTTVLSFAQTTKISNGTGGGSWRDTLTWVGHIIPTLNDSVVIKGTDSVTFAPDTIQVTPDSIYIMPDTCSSVTVLSGGKFTTVPSPSNIFTITNTFTLQANAQYDHGMGSTLLPGNIYVIDNASTVIIRISTTVGQGNNLNFGNLIVQEAQGVSVGGNIVINGDLTVNMAGPTNTFRAITRTMAGWHTCTVHGNVYVNQGQFSAVDFGSDSTIGAQWNIDGNVILANPVTSNARMMTFTSASATGLAIFNIHGNLELQNGARLSAGSSSTRGNGVGIINLYKDFTMTNGANTTTNHRGPLSINFVGTGVQNVRIDTNFNFNQEAIFDTVAATSTVIFNTRANYWSSMDIPATDTTAAGPGGAFVVYGTLVLKDSSRLQGWPTFVLKPGATLKIGSAYGIPQYPDSTHGNIRVTKTRIFDPAAAYEFNSTLAQSTGNGLPSNISSLTINNSAGVKLSVPILVTGTLSVASGTFNLNGNVVTLGPSGVLSETPGNTAQGTVVVTRTVSQNVAESFGGIGLTINAAGGAPGQTTIHRITGVAQTFHSQHSILRSFDIAPTTNSGLNATLDYFYDNSELNSENAGTLALWKSEDAGATWSSVSSSVNTGLNRVRALGVNSFSRFTAADSSNQMDKASWGYDVLNGWNMISLPLIVADSHKTTLFPTASSGAFKFSNGYTDAQYIDPGVGYWLKFPSAQTVPMFGTPIEVDTLTLTAGWNMIGSLNDSVPLSNIVQLTSGVIVSPFYGFAGGYISVDSKLAPLHGYWIKANTGGGQIILSAGALEKSGVQGPNPLNTFNTVTLTDKNGSTQTLYIGNPTDTKFNSKYYEMPPTPPAGIFDARFASQRFVEVYSPNADQAVTYPVVLQSAAYPVTVSWNIRDGSKGLMINGSSEASGFTHAMSGVGKFVMQSPASQLNITVSSQQFMPKQFALSENYPNPFNPTTKIDVALPVQSRITLRVFNILGEEVAQLASGDYAGGNYSFTWQGIDNSGVAMSSGVYFYRLDASSLVDAQTFSVIRKMVMMK